MNVNHALSDGIEWLLLAGLEEPSRNGPVIVSPEPVMTTYLHPEERVLFSPMRDANPFFHLMESLWMLSGSDEIEFPVRFNKNFAQFSDDGETQHGAYGYRWRRHFGYDQLPVIIEELQNNPETRRCVLQMWDAGQWSVEIDGYNPRLVGYDDLHYAMTPGTKDAPCNTHIYFDARGGKVNMTVLCRSNDIYWGAYGANAVHFSMLQEYVAAMAGYDVGLYRQFSNNFHVYTELYPNLKGRDALKRLSLEARTQDKYNELDRTLPLISDPETWDNDLSVFMTDPLDENDYLFGNDFFSDTAVPMYRAWHDRKNGFSGIGAARNIAAPDWREACVAWITRREAKKNEPHTPSCLTNRIRTGEAVCICAGRKDIANV